MTKTKEYHEAVEKLLPIVAEIHSGNQGEGRAIIEAILNALKIEIVSRESEPQEGNLIQWGIEWLGVASKNDDSLSNDCMRNTHYQVFLSHQKAFTLVPKNECKIIQRNSKPAVYVENIGGKDEGNIRA